MRTHKLLDYATDVLLAAILLGIFTVSFFFTYRLNPKLLVKPDNVLGVSSKELALVTSDSLTYSVLDASDSYLKAKVSLKPAVNKIITNYDFLEIKNILPKDRSYALYFDLDKEDFQYLQVLLVSENNVIPIFEAGTSDLKIKDQKLTVPSLSMVNTILRTVAISEDLPQSVSFEIEIKALD